MSKQQPQPNLQKLLDLKRGLEQDLERLGRDTDETEQELAASLSYDDRVAGLAALARDRELDISLEEKVKLLLERVVAAIAEIDAGSYGTCKSCGRQISKERLEFLPYAERCVECQRQQEMK